MKNQPPQSLTPQQIEVLKKKYILNTQKILALNGIEKGNTVFIIGASPQLNQIPYETLRKLDGCITIGLNRVPYKVQVKYFLSAYICEAELAKRLNPRCTAIHMRPVYQPPILDDVLTTKRAIFDERIGLNTSFTQPEPLLFTKKNLALAATHLALILGAAQVVYVGVEQRNELHFYHTDEQLKKRMADHLLKLKTISLINLDHPHQSVQNLIDWMNKPYEELVSNPYYTLSHRESFQHYFNILNQCGVEVFSTVEDSVITDAGAKVKPLDEWIS